MKSQGNNLLFVFGLALGAVSTLYGQKGYEAIDFPGAASTQSWGINPRGEVVGFYVTADKVTHGFLRSGGRFTSIDFPGASSTLANGINPRGDIVAEYTAAAVIHGVLLSGMNSFPIAFPGAAGTEPIGINPGGDIVGDYITADKTTHGFLLNGDRFTTIDYPGAISTIPQSINLRGQIVGGYRDAAGSSHGFLRSDGSFTSFDYPGATFTTATGINARGEIVGRYTAAGANHGYVLSGGKFTAIDVPGASFTGATAVNANGDILGRCTLSGVNHGFLMSAQGHYLITDLGPVGPQPGQPFFITSNGIVSGAAAGSGNTQHAFLWYGGSGADITPSGHGAQNSIAFGANTSGQAVGEVETSITDPRGEDFCGFKTLGLTTSGASCVPFLWQFGVMNALPGLGGGNGAANMINSRGEVAGLAENTTYDPVCPAPQLNESKPVFWDGNGIHELPTFAGDKHGAAFSINDSGAAVGTSGDCSAFNPNYLVYLQPLHALLWQTGSMTDLGNLGGSGHGGGNIALSINNLGQVVGNSDLPGDAEYHAFLWTRQTGMQDLGTLQGDTSSAALAVNDNGEIVGISMDADFNLRSYHWQDGVMTDLNAVEENSALYLLLAASINAQGEIAGLAVDQAGAFHAYLATPTNAATEGAALSASRPNGPPPLPENVRRSLLSGWRRGGRR